MKIEKEMRFYFSEKSLDEVAGKLRKNYKYLHSYYEITTMYDNPNPELTFYSKEIDGRLRLRCSRATTVSSFGEVSSGDFDDSQCLVTWKRRIPTGRHGGIMREEEIEYKVTPEESESVKAIFEDVLKCKRVSSYERIRSFLSTDFVQITCDQFPYGLMIEFELKGNLDEGILIEEIQKIGLDSSNASNMSCDDMYRELCLEQGVTLLSDIKFDDITMPKIK